MMNAMVCISPKESFRWSKRARPYGKKNYV